MDQKVTADMNEALRCFPAEDPKERVRVWASHQEDALWAVTVSIMSSELIRVVMEVFAGMGWRF